MSINQEIMKSAFEALKSDLGDGFVATEIWSTKQGLPLIKDHGYNNNPKVAPLFNEVTRKLYKTLQESAYPDLGEYYMVNLDNNHLVVVIKIGEYQQFVLVDLAKTPMGVLMSIALPNLLNMLAEEIVDESPKEVESPGKVASPEKIEISVEEEKVGSTPGAEKKDSQQKKFSLREVLSAFSEGGYYSDKIKE